MSTYEISKSSLLSLKAEILKKQEELHKAKVENNIKLQREQKKPLELKNKGIENRAANDGDNIDEDLLRKSRSALEAKSKLYDKLSRGSKNEEEKVYNRRYLVHFDKKAHIADVPPEDDDDEDKYPHSDDDPVDPSGELSDGDWVEFVDSFGRTRTCLRQDLAAFKEKDKQMQPREDHKPKSRSPSPEAIRNEDSISRDEEEDYNEKSELLSADMRRELQRQEWEREEQLLQDKSDVHYQDILFKEARTHGVGYYGFSKDEAIRKKQQEDLKNLRKETEAQQKRADEIKQSREKQLAARIRAAKNRKRARDGLPPITSDDEEEEKRAAAAAEAALKEAAEKEEKAKLQKSKIAERHEAEKELSRQTHIRPWDLGKEGVDPVETARIRSGTRDPYDQNEWNAIQRNKRVQEFAPPQAYDTSNYVARNNSRKTEATNPYKREFKSTPIQNECSSDDDEQDELLKDYGRTQTRANIPPPATYEYYGPTGATKRAKPTQLDMEDAIMQGLKYFREKVEQERK